MSTYLLILLFLTLCSTLSTCYSPNELDDKLISLEWQDANERFDRSANDNAKTPASPTHSRKKKATVANDTKWKIVLSTKSDGPFIGLWYALAAHGYKVVGVEKDGTSDAEVDVNRDIKMKDSANIIEEVIINRVDKEIEGSRELFGKEEAETRIKAVLEKTKVENPEADEIYTIDSFIDIEEGRPRSTFSGITDTPRTYTYGVAVGCFCKGIAIPHAIIAESTGVKVPNRFVQKARFAVSKRTVAEVMKEVGWIDNIDDPELSLVETARHVFFAEAVSQCMRSMVNGLTNVNLKFIPVYGGEFGAPLTSVVIHPNTDPKNLKFEIIAAAKRAANQGKGKEKEITEVFAGVELPKPAATTATEKEYVEGRKRMQKEGERLNDFSHFLIAPVPAPVVVE